MKRNLAIILMLLSWPVSVFDRLWAKHPVDQRHFYPLAPAVENDLQWYIRDICSDAAYLLIFSGIILAAKLPPGVLVIFKALCLIQFIDLLHYLLWYRHSEIVLSIEGIIMMFATGKMLYNGKRNGTTA